MTRDRCSNYIYLPHRRHFIIYVLGNYTLHLGVCECLFVCLFFFFFFFFSFEAAGISNTVSLVV